MNTPPSHAVTRGLVLAAMMLGAVQAAGQTFWNNAGGDSLWSNPDNWSTGLVPDADDTRINTASDAENPVRVTGAEPAIPRRFSIGVGPGDAGYLLIENGSLIQSGVAGPFLYVGEGGYGSMTVADGGLVAGNRHLYIGNLDGSEGIVTVEQGGSIVIDREIFVGSSGTGTLVITNGTVSLRNLFIGSNSTGYGIVELNGENAAMPMLSNSQTIIGVDGFGMLWSRGGTTGGGSNRADVRVRDAEDGLGVYRGWGVNTSTRQLRNNGLVIADGEGVERDLDFTSLTGYSADIPPTPPWGNTIENTTTNGWYAVNQGRLLLAPRTLGAGEDVVLNWAEAEDDEEIDLVNSLRFHFDEITASGALTASLLAADRSDVPAAPSNRALIGVWDCSFAGSFTTLNLQARFDHVAADEGLVKLLRWNESTESWDELGNTLLSGYRVAADSILPQGDAKIGLIAAAKVLPPSGTVIFVQ